MVLASVIAGASGGALANVALSPLGGGAGMLQSYWYGAGLILGERDMYTFHWEKIKKRLESGEDYLSVLEGEMTPAITAIANFSLEIMEKTSQIYLTAGVDMLAKLVENMLMLLAGEKPNEMNCPPGTRWDSVMQVCRPTTVEPTPEPEPTPTPTIDCPSGFRWSDSAQQCVPEDIPEPEPTPTPTPEPEPTRPPDSVIINIAIGKTRNGISLGVIVYSLWVRKDLSIPGSDLSNWIRAVTGKFSLASATSTGDSVWPSANYRRYKIGSDVYWVLLKDL